MCARWPQGCTSRWACWPAHARRGYGRIWRLPVSFTIDRAGRLVEDGWKEKVPSFTPERLEQLVTPLLG